MCGLRGSYFCMTYKTCGCQVLGSPDIPLEFSIPSKYHFSFSQVFFSIVGGGFSHVSYFWQQVKVKQFVYSKPANFGLTVISVRILGRSKR